MRRSYQEYARFEDTVAENKEKLNQAFKFLRKNGMIARQNFTCCQSCGGYAIGTYMEGQLDKGKSQLGYVFYHHQDAEALKSDGYRSDGNLYLAYGDGSTNKYPNNVPKSSEEIGKMIFLALTQAGLVVEWNGDSDTRILVKMAEKTAEKVEADTDTWGE